MLLTVYDEHTHTHTNNNPIYYILYFVCIILIFYIIQVTINQVSAIFKKFYSNFSSNLRLIRQLEQQQQKVETQDEWMDIAEQIDNIQCKTYVMEIEY